MGLLDGYTWEMSFPKDLENKNSVNNFMNDWKKLLEQAKDETKETEVWSELPCLPGIKFLNLEIKDIKNINEDTVNENINEINFTFTYDKYVEL